MFRSFRVSRVNDVFPQYFNLCALCELFHFYPNASVREGGVRFALPHRPKHDLSRQQYLERGDAAALYIITPLNPHKLYFLRPSTLVFLFEEIPLGEFSSGLKTLKATSSTVGGSSSWNTLPARGK